MRYRFGEFRLDTSTGQLLGPDGPVVVRRQSWRLLVELLEQAPSLVERDQLLDRVWGRSALSPNALPQTISELRQALGDSAREPRYIETCHGRGYRLLCEVERIDLADSSTPASPDPEPDSNRSWLIAAAVLLGVLAITAPVAFSLLSDPGTEAGLAADSDTSTDSAFDLDRIERLRRQAEVALGRNDHESAAAHLRALSVLQPEDGEILLALADAELDSLQGENARRTLALLATRLDLHEHPRWLLLRTRQAQLEGELDQAENYARAALLQAESLGQVDWLERSALELAATLQRKGELVEAEEMLLEVQHDHADMLGERSNAELTLSLLINLREQGRIAEALTLVEPLAEANDEQALAARIGIEQSLIEAKAGQSRLAWERLIGIRNELAQPPDPDLAIALHNAIGVVGIEVGEEEQALGAFEDAFALARRSGRAWRVAGLQINAGSLLARRDRFEAAENLWQDALEVFEQIGDRRGEATALGNLAAAASAQGQNERSARLNQRALAHFRELGLDGPRARTAFNLALIASREGRLDEAEELLSEAQAGYQRLGQTELVLHVGAYRIDHRVLAGDLQGADTLLAQMEPLLKHASPLRQAALLASRARLAQWRGDLEAARADLESALALRKASGQAAWVATSELELLQLDILTGEDPWRVRVRAGELVEEFLARGQHRAAARAHLVAAEALLSQGELVPAREELAEVRQLQRQFADASLALDLAWVEVWAAREEERLPRLESLAGKAREQGFLGKLAQIEAGQISPRQVPDPEPVNHPVRSETRQMVAVLPPYVTASRDIDQER